MQNKRNKARVTKFSSGFSQELSRDNPSPMKFIDTQFIALTGGANILNLPIQGTTSNDRVGDIIQIENIQIDMHQHLVFGTTTPDHTRTIILQTKGLFGAVPPAVTDVLEPIGGGVAPWSPYVFNARELFEILYDSEITLSPTGDSNVVQRHAVVKPKIPRLRFELGGGIVYSGQLFLLQISWNGTVVASQNIRVHFKG